MRHRVPSLFNWTLPRNFLGGKVRPARRADNSVVPVMPNVKVGMEA